MTKIKKSTKGGALVDTFKGNNSGENEDERQQESEDENGVEKGSVRDMASCDLDLHQVNKAIAGRYRDASHARREVKLHPCLRSPTGADSSAALNTPSSRCLARTKTKYIRLRLSEPNPARIIRSAAPRLFPGSNRRSFYLDCSQISSLC